MHRHIMFITVVEMLLLLIL